MQNKILSRPGFEPGLLRPQRSVLTTRRSGPMSKPFFLVLVFFRVFSSSELLPVILLFRHERLIPATVQNKILSGQGFEPGLLRPQPSVLTTRRSGPISKPSFLALMFEFFSSLELLPVILLFRHEWLFPSPVQSKILSRPGFEPGLLRPQRSVLTTRRSGPMSKPFFLVLVLLESFFVVRVATSYSVIPS